MYPERVNAFSDLIKDDKHQRDKIDKLRVKKMDSKGVKEFIKFTECIKQKIMQALNQLMNYSHT